MNALYRDLTALVRHFERENLPRVKADPRRLHYHLMPPVGWMNDPNGLCWYQGNYHVFYQYSPFNPDRGVIFWGHYSSPDLLHWQQQPVFLCPDQPWNLHGVYSGSALAEEDKLYLYYTGSVKFSGDYDFINTGRGSNTALAVSRDGIRPDENRLLLENKDYPHDLSCHVRDPKVWKQDGKYYMVLGARTKSSKGQVLVYESQDKVSWQHINTIQTPEPFGYMWECPDLFQVDGQYILSLSPQGVAREKYRFQNVYSCGYFPLNGDFRGECTLGAYQEADQGFDYYAPQTFLAPDGRRIVLGWMGMPDADYGNPTAAENGWQHAMSVPRELHWNGKAVTAQPVKELEALRRNSRFLSFDGISQVSLSDCSDLLIGNQGNSLTVRLGTDAEITYAQGLLTLTFSGTAGQGRTRRTVEVEALRNLRILVDTSSLELFLNDGEQVMTSRFYPESVRTLTLEGSGTAELYDMAPMTVSYLEDK